MTDTINGQISAFIDDEIMDEEGELLIRRLCNDEELRRTAARYTLIGDAVRGSLDEIRADLNGSIMRAIEHEPMPEAAAVASVAPTRDWRRLAGGGAVAAAVAVMAVLAIQPDAPIQEPRIAQGLNGGIVVPANDQTDPLSLMPQVSRASNQAALQEYLLRHNQYSKTTMRQGVLVYRTVTGDEARVGAQSGGVQDDVKEMPRSQTGVKQP